MSDKPCSRENGFRVDCIKLYGDISAENARLKAEVERLRCLSDELNNTTEYLEAEVERLRKAGDAMADAFPSPNFPREHYALKAWNAAKEGKQS